MGKTKIEWADSVWNPVTGCTPISEGCQNCYAKRMATRLRGRCGYPVDNPFKVTLHPDKLDQPLRWKKPRRVFVCSMGDLFHDDVPDEFIFDVFEKMLNAQLTNGHKFLVLTKRPTRMKPIIEAIRADQSNSFPLPNIWLGVTAENQAMADERIPILLETPAAVRFVSVEPMVGPVDIVQSCDIYTATGDIPAVDGINKWLDWVICGGETGHKARPMSPDWARLLRDQCQEADVPFFFKQWGEWAPKYRQGEKVDITKLEDTQCVAKARNGGHWLFNKVSKKAAGRALDGREWDEMPCQYNPLREEK